MVAVGVWLDPAGHPHIFPDEICAHMDLPYTEENYRLVVEVFTQDIPRILSGKPCQDVRPMFHKRESDA